MTPLAHAGHWLVNVLYLAPLIIVLLALGYQALRDRRRRGAGPRRPPADGPPSV
jgi:hypothetical protein